MRGLLFVIGVASVVGGWATDQPFALASGLFFIPYSIWGGR